MKNKEIKGSLTLGLPSYNSTGCFMGYLMGLWQVIFESGDKHLSKLVPRSLNGGIHFEMLDSTVPLYFLKCFKFKQPF